ncbi:hypothetical protein [Nocardia crassostreae]|uniref:hypothetical protein n=1 Tax=Nocardia crassostreae TaxID=53428 RepID=UPI0012F7E9C7|nr:hypothetical protein [Nocardia crassostreae]
MLSGSRREPAASMARVTKFSRSCTGCRSGPDGNVVSAHPASCRRSRPEPATSAAAAAISVIGAATGPSRPDNWGAPPGTVPTAGVVAGPPGAGAACCGAWGIHGATGVPAVASLSAPMA